MVSPASPPAFRASVPGAPLPGGGEPAASSAWITGEELLAWRRAQLALGGRAADLDWLLDLGGGIGWAELQKLRLTPRQRLRPRVALDELEALWRRHLRQAAPLQYLVGVCPWRDLELLVAPGVLIPRQETELLLDLALQVADPGRVRLWADLGTGSGALAVALARALPGSAGLAVDLSEQALGQAALNLSRHGLEGQVGLHRGDWWQPLEPWWGRLDLVVANPPYIPSQLLASLDPVVRDHEPALALDGGADGLAAIRRIAAEAPRALAPGGWLLIEHHHDHSPAAQALLRQAGLVQVSPHSDLEGHPRFASARRPETPAP